MRNVIVNHKKHVRNVVCPAHQAACDPFVVCVLGCGKHLVCGGHVGGVFDGRLLHVRRFAQNFIRYHTYEIQVQFIHPAQAFLSQSDVGTLFIDLTLVCGCRCGWCHAWPGLYAACSCSAVSW